MSTRDERVRDLEFTDQTAAGSPVVEGKVRYVSGDLLAYLNGEVKSLTTGSGLNPATHRPLDQLVHNIAENSHEEFVYDGNNITNIIIWQTSSKLKKIKEETYTYAANRVTQIVTEQYDGNGDLIVGESYTQDITYDGNNVDFINGVLS
jgi:hypothetical protein